MNSLGQPRRAALPRIALILAVLILGALAALYLLRPEPAPVGNLANSSIGGPFTLVDEDGRTVTEASFPGQWKLIYFGYTFCPDVCPVDTANLGAGLNAFEAADPKRGAKVQPLFVTIDPARDDAAALKEFTANFHPRLIGLGGSEAQVAAAAKAYRVFYARGEEATPGNYLMDHSAILYLFDPQGRPVEFIAGPAATPEEVAAMLDRFVR